MKEINIFGFLIFAVLTCITPGPNNIMLFTMGKCVGFRKTIPVMLGVFFGFMVLLAICGYGLFAITTNNLTNC
jgi:threonine/homoserine/homoserine lactone efflux protein